MKHRKLLFKSFSNEIENFVNSTNLLSNEIENIVKLFDPTATFQIIKSFEIPSCKYKFQHPIIHSNSIFYSMTYNSSA